MGDDDDAVGIPEWVVTFGDMMSLLLTFFIMLVSMSEIKKEEHFQALVESFRRQFGHDDSMNSVVAGTAQPRNSHLSNLATMGRAKRFSTQEGGDKVKAPVGDSPQVRIIRPGSSTAVGTVIYFPGESAKLTDEMKRDLQVQAQEFGGKPQKIEIRGHAAPKPLAPGAPFVDHYDLGYERCRAVMNFLVSLGIDPRRIRISTAGKNEPIHIGTDPLKSKQNPRVEVFLLDEVVDDLVGSGAEQSQRITNGGPTGDTKP
ncbi:OmpA/MotB family protein [Blastopirellula marina]|uniref:Putative MotB-like protein n=1 Tax=Blastopirellula marina DSM 3645 TaxID=314230 RepID=A3ZNY4_9BACT|nr:flagellar motor protein MotB [Blastopirellula marina]EAQ82032.1 putative MotB-like protein [Blastopirellula marina DSM 3645]